MLSNKDTTISEIGYFLLKIIFCDRTFNLIITASTSNLTQLCPKLLFPPPGKLCYTLILFVCLPVSNIAKTSMFHRFT